MPTRDEAIQLLAQRRADFWPELWARVRQIGTEQAAQEIWYPGHTLSVDEIQQRLDAQLAAARAA